MEENNKIILEKAKGEIEQSMKKQKKQLHINIFAIVIMCIVFCLIMFLCLFNKFSHTEFRIIDVIDIIDSIKIYALILIIGILVIVKPMLKEIKNLNSMHNNIEKNEIFSKYGTPEQIKKIRQDIINNIIYEDDEVICSNEWIVGKTKFVDIINIADISSITKDENRRVIFINSKNSNISLHLSYNPSDPHFFQFYRFIDKILYKKEEEINIEYNNKKILEILKEERQNEIKSVKNSMVESILYISILFMVTALILILAVALEMIIKSEFNINILVGFFVMLLVCFGIVIIGYIGSYYNTINKYKLKVSPKNLENNEVFSKYGSPEQIQKIRQEVLSSSTYEDSYIACSDKWIISKNRFTDILNIDDVYSVINTTHRYRYYDNIKIVNIKNPNMSIYVSYPRYDSIFFCKYMKKIGKKVSNSYSLIPNQYNPDIEIKTKL